MDSVILELPQHFLGLGGVQRLGWAGSQREEGAGRSSEPSQGPPLRGLGRRSHERTEPPQWGV